MRKLLKPLLSLMLLVGMASAQSVVFYTDRALGVNPFTPGTGGVPSPVFLAFAQVRVCTLPLTLGTPCSTPASITDIFGNPLTIVGGNFGQLTTDVVGRFSFGCTPGLYQVQVAATGSNTPSLAYPFTCPSGTSALLSTNNTWTGTNTFLAGIGLGNSLTLSSTGTHTGFLNLSSGLATQSSIEVTGGVVRQLSNDGYYDIMNNNHRSIIQAGPRTPGALQADSTMNTPDCANGGITNAACILLAITGTADGVASGHCLSYGTTLMGLVNDTNVICGTGGITLRTLAQKFAFTDDGTGFNSSLFTRGLTAPRSIFFPDASGDVVLSGSGTNSIQVKRGTAGCATAAGVGAPCATVVTWTPAFADANYTVQCGGRLITSGVPVNGGITNQVAASVTFQTVATTAVAAQYTNIDCIAKHD